MQTNETMKAQMELQVTQLSGMMSLALCWLQRRDLETEHTLQLNNMQHEYKQLKSVKDKMEEIQQDLDSMRDNIATWYIIV